MFRFTVLLAHFSGVSLLSWALSNGDFPEVAVIGIYHPVAGDGGRINVQSNKPMDLILCQISRVAKEK